MPPNWRCIWGKITRSTGLTGLSDHDTLFYSWGFTQPDAWGLLRRDDAKAAVFPKRSNERRVQEAIDHLIERKKLCEHQHNGHAFIHWCNWDEWQPETVRWRTRSNLEPPFSFVCPNECGPVRTSPLEKKRKERETETKGNTPLKPPLEGGAAGQPKRRRRRREMKDRDDQGNPIPGAHSGRYIGFVQR